MKKCPYCGKEYPDEITHCERDNYLLLGDSPAVMTEVAEPPPLPPPLPSSDAVPRFTERQMQIIEIVLVCLVAFSGGILTSVFALSDPNYGASGRSTQAWIVQFVRQFSVLAFVWYLLLRRGKTFSDLGLVWARKDIPLSILLYIGRGLAFNGTFHLIMLLGLSDTDIHATSVHVNRFFYGPGGGISFLSLSSMCLNPFFEELIVRAYLMTGIKELTNSASKAIIISTLVQTSYHFYQGVPAAFSHGVAFLVYSIYYSKTNRITPVLLSHLYSDVCPVIWYAFRS